MDILIIVAVILILCAASNILCFIVGAKVGQVVTKGEEIKLPEVSPVKAFEEHRSRKAAKREADQLSVLLHNIDVYDGTGAGQKDIPGEVN
ncbi:MAG: hypothetical protein IKW68_03620 [Clostridia bacterium]|nr:hypothetical protein [Clostridia bacterium]